MGSLSSVLKIALPALAALWVSCSRPMSDEIFVRAADRDDFGRYVFPVEMSDSLFVYDVELLASMSCDDYDFEEFSGLPLLMMWESPDGRLFEEKVWLGKDSFAGGSFYIKHFKTMYRRDLSPVCHGTWRLLVSVAEEKPVRFGLNGLGMRLIRKQRTDGTR